MKDNRKIPTATPQLFFKFDYIKAEESKPATVYVQITHFTGFLIPFDILKEGFYQMSERHKASQKILIPEKKIELVK